MMEFCIVSRYFYGIWLVKRCITSVPLACSLLFWVRTTTFEETVILRFSYLKRGRLFKADTFTQSRRVPELHHLLLRTQVLLIWLDWTADFQGPGWFPTLNVGHLWKNTRVVLNINIIGFQACCSTSNSLLLGFMKKSTLICTRLNSRN